MALTLQLMLRCMYASGGTAWLQAGACKRQAQRELLESGQSL